MFITTILNSVKYLMGKPLVVLCLCLMVLLLRLVVQGEAMNLISLSQKLSSLKVKNQDIQEKIKKYEMKIEKISEPQFLEFEVRDRLPIAEKGDLVFIFSNGTEE